MAPIEQIQQGVEAGNFLALAKAISAIENNDTYAVQFLESLRPAAVPIIALQALQGLVKAL